MMAELGELQVRVHPFFTTTRMYICHARDCVYHEVVGLGCSFKTIEMSMEGWCKRFTLSEKADVKKKPDPPDGKPSIKVGY